MFRARLFGLSFGLGGGFRGRFFESEGEEEDKGGANEDAAHDVGEPVNTGDETTEGDDEGEKGEDEVDDGCEFRFDVVMSEEDGGAGKSKGKEGMRGRIRSFQDAVDENGTEVDDEDFFKEEVDGAENEIETGEKF